MLRLGALEIPKVPGVYGAPLNAVEKQLQLDLDGVIGAGLLAYFRITFGDGGRLMWLEDDTAVNKLLRGSEPAPADEGQAPAAPPDHPGPAGEAGSPAPKAQPPAAPPPPAAAPRRTPDR
jgi:hypothetical protein